jgi:hypothetical protein
MGADYVWVQLNYEFGRVALGRRGEFVYAPPGTFCSLLFQIMAVLWIGAFHLGFLRHDD